MRVVATAPGFDNVKLREPGEEFDMPDGSKGSWFRPVVKRKGPADPAASPPQAPTPGSDLT